MGKKKKRLEEDEVDAARLADDGSRKLLLGFAFVLFLAGFAVAIIAVFFRPQRLVLVGGDAREVAWYEETLAPFAETHHANLKVVAYHSLAEFDSILAADQAAKSHKLLLVEAPFDRLGKLADAERVLPLKEVKGLGDPDAFLGPFTPAAVGPSKVAGRAFFVPSRLTTVCLAYSKARVADAVAHADEVRSLVEGWLRPVNGAGLPGDFRLEDDPAEWDSYDLLVVAAYWATQPFVDGTAPRVAHPVAPASALGFDLAARAFSMGAQPDEVLALEGFGVRDALSWESLWFEHGLYDTSMVAQKWTPEDVANALVQGRIWLATLEPAQVLRLHGLAADSSRTKTHAADIALARLPRGVSLELRNKFPERAGDPWSARGGHWWAVPEGSPDPRLAGDVIRFVTAPEPQADAARRLGWIPVRGDLVDDIGNVYKVHEEFDLARQAMRQIYDFGKPLPTSPHWPAASDALARAWEDASVRRHTRAPLELAEALRQALGGRR